MSSPNHPTSNIEDAFSSNFLDFIPASPDYVPTSPRKAYSSSSNSFGVVLIASPSLSLFYNDPYIKVLQAFYAKESPIPPPNPITLPIILTPSLVLPPSPLFDPRHFFIPEELLPPKKQIHPPSSSSTTLSNSSRKQAYILVPPSFSTYTPTSPQIYELRKSSIKIRVKHHEEQVESILNYLEELSFHRINKMKERLVNGWIIIPRDFDEVYTKLKEARIQIRELQRNVVSTAKLPILNPNEFDLWKMRFEQYFLMTDYSLWEVILNGDSLAPTRVVKGVLQLVAPTTAEQKLARKNELKARGTLLIALPDKHQLKFNSHKEAKILMEAIEKRFRVNTKTKKVQKTLLKQQYKNFTGSSLKSLDHIHDRLQKLTDLEKQSLDDLFNSLKIYEAEVKSSSSAVTTTQNIAFVSSSNTDNTTEPVSAATSVFAICAKIHVSSLPNVDSLSNAMAMLTMRARRFLWRIGRNLGANGPTSMGFDMSIVECYNCHKKGHFARECRSPKDSRRNGAAEPHRRNVLVENSTSNALVSQYDGVGSYDWSFQIEEEPANYALMVFSSLSSSFEMWFQSSDGYHAVPPSYRCTFMPPKPDLVFNNAPNGVETDHFGFTIKLSPTKPDQDLSHTYRPSAPIIEDWSTKLVKSPRLSVQHVETSILVATLKPASPKPPSNGKRRNMKACSVCKSLDHLIKDCDYHEKKMAKPTTRNYAHRGNHKHYALITHPTCQMHMVPATVLTQSKPGPITVVRPGNSQHALKDKGVIDSGCSRLHMDLFGPTFVKSLNKKCYFLVVTDDYSRTPSIGFIRPFGCPVTILNDLDSLGKFERKEPEFDKKKPESEVIVSPSSSAQSKKHNDKTKREAKGKSPIESYTGYRNLSVEFEDYFDNSINKVNVVDASQLLDDPDTPKLEDITYSDEKEDVGAEADFNNLETSITVSPIPTTRVHKDHHVTQIIGDLSSATQTRSMTRVAKDQGRLSQMFNDDFHTCMFACFLSQEESKRVHQALKDPSWIKAMQEELLKFKMQKVWVLVDLPYAKRAIGTKWVCRNKNDERSIVVRNKARLVAQGHTQEEGIDYKEVFALVAKIEAIRLFLAYASFMGFMMYQMDVKSAFLYGTIEEVIYVCQPLGFEDPNHPDKVYKVVKALYGLHQTPKAWYETLANYLLENGFQRGKIDQTLFIKRQKDGKSASTPIDTEKPLLKDPDGEDVNVHIYRSMIKSLMYLTSSRPDIMFAEANSCGTSSTEAEYVAAASCYAQVLWIQNQLLDYGLESLERMIHVTTILSAGSLTSQKMVLNSPCLTHIKNWLVQIKRSLSWLVQKQTDLNKEKANPLIVDSLLKTIWSSIHHLLINEVLTIPRQTTTGKEISNPFMAEACCCMFNDEKVSAAKSKFSAISIKSPLLGVNTPRCDEDRLEVMELMVFLLPMVEKVRVEVYAVDLQTTVAVKTVDDVIRLQALVDKKKVVVTEATIREALHLDDAKGVECFPNEEIFTELARMGYEKPSTKLTFYKAFFSSQWKFPIDTILQCMSAKRTSGMNSVHQWHLLSYAYLQKVFANMRRVGKGFLGVETPLFEGMFVEQQVAKEGDAEVHGEEANAGDAAEGDVCAANDEVPTVQPQSPQPQPQPQQDDGIPMNLLQEVMDTCTALSRRVEPLELDKIAQALEFTKLKRRLKRRNKGRMIVEMDQDADVVLEEAKEVAEDAKVVDVVTTTKIITKVITASSKTITAASTTITAAEAQVPAVTLTAAPTRVIVAPSRRRKGVVIRDPQEEPTTSKIIPVETKSKDKGKEILDEAIDHVKKKAKEDPVVKRFQVLKRKPHTEAQARKNIMVYLKNVAGFKMDYFKGMSYDDTRPIFEAKFNTNVAFLQKTKEQIEEEESRALKRLNETPTEKAAKR
nr:putative ribonuclease H-like domain-containing protein [Tanacetum cinerariifolium]